MTNKTKAILSIILSCVVAVAAVFGINVYSSCHSAGNFDFMFKKIEKEVSV